ncbi:MAG: hypothetical protein KKA05_03600 [Alphaproteobacteria bacterium]|nr:hypothetical protein [Alphaproteobacteria bacterium]MBU0858434.1 hypothetical protein [Alphaproteobacteria bacterium]
MAMQSDTKGLIGLFGAAVLLMTGFMTAAVIDEQAQESMQNALAATFNNATFTLEGAHAVTSDYEGRKYTYNFDNNSVLGGQTRHVGFGGGGYGGMVSFDNFEDKAAIATARVMGCGIAAHMAVATNPGWPVTAEFKSAQRKAADFTQKYCP